MLKLRLLTGPRAGRHLRVHDTKPVSIGRRVGRLRLHDSRVSKHHAEISFTNGTWVLRDLGSANGTFINRERVEGITELEGGDLIQMGRVLIKVRSADAVGMDPVDAVPQDPVADAMDDLLATTPDPAPPVKSADSAKSSELLGDEIDIQAMLTELDKKDGIDPDDSDFDLDTPDEKAKQDAPVSDAEPPAPPVEPPPGDPDSDLISLADEDPPAPRPGTTVITAIEESGEKPEQEDDAEESGIDEVFAPTRDASPAGEHDRGEDDDAADQIAIGDDADVRVEAEDALEIEDAVDADQADEADDKPELVGLLLSQKPPQQPVFATDGDQEDHQPADKSPVDEVDDAVDTADTDTVDNTLEEPEAPYVKEALEESSADPLDAIDELDESPSVFDIAADPDFELDVETETGLEPEQADVDADAISDALSEASEDGPDQAKAIDENVSGLVVDAEADTAGQDEVAGEVKVEDPLDTFAEVEDGTDIGVDDQADEATNESDEVQGQAEAEPDVDVDAARDAEPEAEPEPEAEQQTQPEPESPQDNASAAALGDRTADQTPDADDPAEGITAGAGGDEGPDFDIDAAFNALSAGLDDSFRLPAIDSADEPAVDKDDPWSLDDTADEPDPPDEADAIVDAEADIDAVEDSDESEGSDAAEDANDTEAAPLAGSTEAELLAEIEAAPEIDAEPESQAELEDGPGEQGDAAADREKPQSEDDSDQAASEHEDTDAPAKELLAGSQLDVGFIQDALARLESDGEQPDDPSNAPAEADAELDTDTDADAEFHTDADIGADVDQDSASDLQELEKELLASLEGEDEADDESDLDALAAELESGSADAFDHDASNIDDVDAAEEDADEESHALADLDADSDYSIASDDEIDTSADDESDAADNDVSAVQGLVIPQSQATPPGLKTPTTVLPEEDSDYEYEPRDAGKPGLLVFGTVVVLCLLIGGGWFGYQAYLKSQTNGSTGADTTTPQQPPAGAKDVRTGDNNNPDATTPPPSDPTDPDAGPTTPVDNDPSDPSADKTTDGDPKDPTPDPTDPKSDPDNDTTTDKTDPSDDAAADPNAPNPFAKGPAIEGGDAVTGLTLPENPETNPGGTDKQPDGTGTTTAGSGDNTDKTPEVKPRPLGRPVDEVGKVIFLVDASGSLVDTMPQMLLWLGEAVKTIRPNEQFAVVFFKAGRFIETEPKGLQSPTKELLTKLGQEWLDPEAAPVLPTGRSDPREAIKHAMGLKPTDIYLLSDESFGRFAGDTTRDQAIDLVTQAIGEAKIRVHGVQFFYDEKDASVLQALSNKFGGTYEFVKEDVVEDASPSDLLKELDRED